MSNGNRQHAAHPNGGGAAKRPDLSDRPASLQVSREVVLSPERVYEAFTTRRFEDWFAARGTLSMRAEEGAPFFFATEHEGKRHPHYGRFLKLDPARRIEMTWLTEDGTHGAETVLTITLEPSARGTSISLRHEGFSDTETMERHREAWPSVLARLDSPSEAAGADMPPR